MNFIIRTGRKALLSFRAYSRKGMRTIFQKKGKKRANKGEKYLKIWAKCTKFEKTLKKGWW